MQIKETSKRDIEARLASMGDYVKIDYLSELLRGNIDYDTRRYVLLTLAKLYKNKSMLAEAARLVNNAAEINTTYEGMMRDHSVAMQLFIQAGKFDEADVAMNKAIASCNNESQKSAVKVKRKDAIKTQAEDFLKRDKRKQAMLAYEKLVSLQEVTSDEKRDAQDKLIKLYEQLGKVKEFYGLRKGM
jgi:tetratricopeptide (TPR) repeat protein